LICALMRPTGSPSRQASQNCASRDRRTGSCADHHLDYVAPQRRNPVRVAAMKAVRQIDKAGVVTAAAQRDDLDLVVSGRPPCDRGSRVRNI